ncbi:hypothetical protein HYV30_04115 [Candidatus Kaiserbacteria bacterium]|nr:hypothetical protein [Candidatus Kaiserbacteria bacterium]
MGTDGIFGRARQTLLILDQQGLTEEEIDTIHGGHLAALAQAARKRTLPDLKSFRQALGLESSLFRLVVDYSLSIEEMLALGDFDVEKQVGERFRALVQKPATVNTKWFLAQYVRFDREVTSARAREEIRQLVPTWWSFAGIEHMLAHAALYPGRQRRFSIASFCPNPVVLYQELSGKRVIGLREEDECLWLPTCRFLLVRPLIG